MRDLLLGRTPKDFDLSTDAEPRQLRKLFRNCVLVGRRFRLAHIRFGRGKVIETSTFRRQPDITEEVDAPRDLLQRDDNQFGTPEEDARRRDFTINGLFYDLSDFSLIDHVGGLSDIRKGLIRSIGDPGIRFREDPVRMIRAVRFASRLGFRIETATRKAILAHGQDIERASPARMLEELFRLFAFRSAEPAFFLLWELKLMAVLLPEVDAYVNNSGQRHSPLWRHLAALDSGEHWTQDPPPALMLAALLGGAIMQHLEAARQQDGPGTAAGRMDVFITPMTTRFRVPKSVYYRLVRILENQERMDQVPVRLEVQPDHRKSASVHRRFLRHETFPESLALLEIRAAAGTAEPDVLTYWRQVADTFSKTPQEGAPGASDTEAPPPKPRRRRRRVRRKPAHEAADS